MKKLAAEFFWKLRPRLSRPARDLIESRVKSLLASIKAG